MTFMAWSLVSSASYQSIQERYCVSLENWSGDDSTRRV